MLQPNLRSTKNLKIMSITIHQVYKRFGNFQALDNISLTIPEGKLVALLGPSSTTVVTPWPVQDMYCKCKCPFALCQNDR